MRFSKPNINGRLHVWGVTRSDTDEYCQSIFVWTLWTRITIYIGYKYEYATWDEPDMNNVGRQYFLAYWVKAHSISFTFHLKVSINLSQYFSVCLNVPNT
jgi:hypothetical protein